MAILNRFICSKHGEFEAWSDDSVRCPMAKCRCKPRQMVSGPAIHTSGATPKIDSTLNNLATDFKMTNLASAREGENQSKHFSHAKNPTEPRPGDSVMWGNQGSLDMGSILKGNRFQSVRGESVGVKPSDVGVKKGPITASYIPDHENLKIEK